MAWLGGEPYFLLWVFVLFFQLLSSILFIWFGVEKSIDYLVCDFFSLKLLVFLLLLLLLFNGNKTRNKQRRIREKSLDKIQEYKTSGALLLFALWMNRMRCFISFFQHHSITALGWIYCLRLFYVCRFLFWHLCVYRFHVLVIAPQRSPSAYDEESKKRKEKWFT